MSYKDPAERREYAKKYYQKNTKKVLKYNKKYKQTKKYNHQKSIK